MTEALITAGVPSLVIAIFGFLAKNTFSDIKTAVGELQKDLRAVLDKLSEQAKAHATLQANHDAVKERVVDLEAQVHKLQSTVTGLQITLGRGSPSTQ